MASSKHDQRIQQLLKSIERDLIDWIPIAIQELKVPSAAYAIFIWYQDYDDDWLPHIGVATDLLLKDLPQLQLDDPSDKYDILWCPQQTEEADAPGRLFLDECELVEHSVDECYELLAESYGLESKVKSLQDEDALQEEYNALLPFREMLHRVALQLQSYHWTTCLKPTEDFAIVVSDYMGYWLDDDLKRSLGPDLMKRLTARDLLPAI
jgi:hypothetical protein